MRAFFPGPGKGRFAGFVDGFFGVDGEGLFGVFFFPAEARSADTGAAVSAEDPYADPIVVYRYN